MSELSPSGWPDFRVAERCGAKRSEGPLVTWFACGHPPAFTSVATTRKAPLHATAQQEKHDARTSPETQSWRTPGSDSGHVGLPDSEPGTLLLFCTRLQSFPGELPVTAQDVGGLGYRTGRRT